MWKTFASGVILIIAATFPAVAQNCHLGVQAGTSIGTAAISLPSVPANIDGLGLRSRSPDVGLAAGCDLRVSGSPFVVGAFADYTWRDTQFSAGLGPFNFSAAMQNRWTVGARVGYVTAAGMSYALLGYTNTDVAYSTPIVGMPTSLHGWTTGGGIEIPMAPNVSFAVETRYTRYADADLFSGFATLRTDEVSAMARLNFVFGANVLK